MLTRSEHRLLEFYGWWASRSALFPFSWDPNSFCTLSATKSIWWKIIGYLNLALSALHVTYLFLRFLDYTDQEYKGFDYQIVIQVLMALTSALVLLMQIQGTKNADTLAVIINQLLHFNKIQGKVHNLMSGKETHDS